MAVPTTISRTAYNLLVDDSGSGTDGSVWDKADVDDILDGVDGLLAAALNVTGPFRIGDDANANQTIGLTINQGTSDDEILSLKSSDVAHGLTSVTETDTYGTFAKMLAGGGLKIVGLQSTAVAYGLQLEGVGAADDTTKSTVAVGPLVIDGARNSGTTATAIGANANLVVVRNFGTTRFILDADGDSHQDVGTAWTNFDFLEDVDALTALSVGVSRPDDPLRAAFTHLLERYRPELEQHGIVTFNADGHHFINWSRTSMLLIGAVRQQAAKLAALETRLAHLLPGASGGQG